MGEVFQVLQPKPGVSYNPEAEEDVSTMIRGNRECC